MSKEIHYEFWLLMIPYYCEKWLNGVDYDELMKELRMSDKTVINHRNKG